METIEETRTPAREDAIVEAAVLRHLLAIHPVQLSGGELVREIAGDAAGFAEWDAVERAVRDLTGAGLTHRDGDVVRPSRAALRLDELLD
jgi:hypothetical protein